MELKLSTIIENRQILSNKLDNIFTSFATSLSSQLNVLNNQINNNVYDEFLIKDILKICLDNINESINLFDYLNDIKPLIVQMINDSNKRIEAENKLFQELKVYYIGLIKLNFSQTDILDKYNNIIGKNYLLNDIRICQVKKYNEYFCSIKNGRPSNIRDTTKLAKSTTWSYSGLKQIILKPYNRNTLNDIYPNTTYGYSGRMISFKEFKDIIISYLNE